nr:MAG TPA: hypothetical protein [Caudoviricetes sp.]
MLKINALIKHLAQAECFFNTRNPKGGVNTLAFSHWAICTWGKWLNCSDSLLCCSLGSCCR